MSDEPRNEELATEPVREGEPIQYVDITSPPSVDGHGGLGYMVEQTLFRGRSGVDVSGVQRGAGHTGITITPSLSMPKKTKSG